MFKRFFARFLTPFYFVFDVIEHYSHFRKYGSFADSFKYIWTDYKFLDKFPKGSIVENCQLHACLVLDNNGESIEYLSLHSGGIGFCSTRYCGIVLLPPDYIEQKIKAYKIAGDKGLAMLEGWSEKDYDEFRKQWRPGDTHIGLTPAMADAIRDLKNSHEQN